MGGFGNDGPAQRGALLYLEERLDDPDRLAVHLDDGLEVVDLQHAVPGAAAQLRVDVSLEARKIHGDQGV